MHDYVRRQLTFANVCACIALIIAIGSASAVALVVTSSDIRDGTIQARDLRRNAVKSSKIATGAVSSRSIGSGQVQASDIGNEAVVPAKLAAVPAAQLRGVATTVPSGVETIIDWSLVGHDTYGMYSLAQPDRLTILRTGIYNIGVSTCFEGDATGVRTLVIMQGSSALQFDTEQNLGAVEGTCVSVQDTRYLTEGTYLRISAYQNSGSTLALSSTESSFWASWVSRS